MASKGVKFTFTVDAANYSAGVNKVVAMNRQIARSAQEAGHATVSSMQASSAAIRELENPMGNNLRAVERFISLIPGVGKALQAAFPVVGALALGSIILETGKKVQEFISHLNGIPAAVNMGAEAIRASMTSTNDELAVAIDRIENANAKIEHRPINGLKLTLDEAAVSSDKLAAALGKDNAELQKLLSAQSTGGFWAQLLGSQASTVKSDDLVAQYGNKIADIHGQGITDRYNAGGDPAKIAAAEQKERAAMRQAAIDQVNAASGRLAANQRAVQQNIMNSGRFDSDNAHLNLIRQNAQGQVLSIDQENRMDKAQGQNATDTEAKEKADEAKRLSAEAAAALRKAQEEVVQQMNAYHESFQNGGARSAQDEMDFWASQVAALSNGSAKYKTALTDAFKNLANDRQRMLEDTAKEQKKWRDETGESDADNHVDLASRFSPDLAKGSEQGFAETGRAVVEMLKSMNEGINLTREFNDAQADQKLALAEATGQITAHDAAIQKMNMHQQQYLNLIEQMKNQGKSDDDIKRAGQDYQLQANADKAAVLNSSFEGQWKMTLNNMANEFTDFGSELTRNFAQTVSDVNGELVKLLTTRYHNGYDTRQQFKAVGKEAFSGIADTGIKGVEGYGMRALQGIFGKSTAKADGSQNSPFYVVMSKLGGAAAAAASSAPAAFTSALSSGIKAGSNIGLDALGSLATVLPGFASGGPVSAGMTAIVGENGPEIAHFNQAATITPNNKVNWGGTHHHYNVGNIDARGSTSPQETKRLVMQGIMQAAPHLTRNSVKSAHEYARRRPASAR